MRTAEKPKPDRRTGLGTIEEVGDFLRISRPTIYRLFALGKLQRVKLAGAVRIPWASVYELVGEK